MTEVKSKLARTTAKSTSDIIDMINEEIKLEQLNHNLNPLVTPRISLSTYYRVVKEVAPEVVKDPIQRTAEGELAMEGDTRQ